MHKVRGVASGRNAVDSVVIRSDVDPALSTFMKLQDLTHSRG
ncbi:hypothetical protein [Desulfitobacterium sp.]|nr:hypothetical protein [Desulfitobacterium sp.]